MNCLKNCYPSMQTWMVGNSLMLKKLLFTLNSILFHYVFTFILFQQKFVLRGGSVLNKLPEVPDTNLMLKKLLCTLNSIPFSICFYIYFFQPKFLLQGGSVLNEVSKVSDTNLLPFDENLDGGQQFDVEKIVARPKFNPFTNYFYFFF